jgi:hypothetical protein
MQIAWDSVLVVFIASFGASAAVVLLVSFALVALSARAKAIESGTASRAAVGRDTAIGGVCLMAAGAIVLYGLYLIAS